MIYHLSCGYLDVVPLVVGAFDLLTPAIGVFLSLDGVARGLAGLIGLSFAVVVGAKARSNPFSVT